MRLFQQPHGCLIYWKIASEIERVEDGEGDSYLLFEER